MKSRILSLCICGGVALIGAACAHESNGEVANTTSTTSAFGPSDFFEPSSSGNTVLPNDRGVEQLASAWCGRRTCFKGNASERSRASEDCMGSSRELLSAQYGASSCPSGIDNDHLQACLNEVSTYACNQYLVSIDTCAPSNVCVSFR